MHETFRRDVPVLLMLDIDKIPHDMVEWFRRELEKHMVAFWNETFSEPMHKITVNNMLWQDSSRYGNGDPYEKGGSLVLIVTDVNRCLQFCSIEAAYTFACRFVNLLLGSDDERLVKLAKECIDLNPLRDNKSIRMTGCGKGVNPETGALAVAKALKQMSRRRVLHPTARERGFTFRDTFLTLKQRG